MHVRKERKSQGRKNRTGRLLTITRLADYEFTVFMCSGSIGVIATPNFLTSCSDLLREILCVLLAPSLKFSLTDFGAVLANDRDHLHCQAPDRLDRI